MSKYHILENLTDSNDNDENDLLAIATTATTATVTTNTLSKSLIIIDDSDRFYFRNDHSNRLAQNAIEQQQDKILNHRNDYNDNDELYYRSRNNRQLVVRDYHDTEDLIDYNNMDDSINGSEIIINKQTSISNNSTTIAADNKHIKLVNNTLNSADNSTSADAYITDDTTMEIPLLQPNCNLMDGNDNRNDSSNNKYQHHNLRQQQHDQYDFECVCQCQQRGFASNLNSSSTKTAKSKILWAISLCCIFMIVEFLGGYIAGSLAIMTDAAHLASDCISFIIGLVAIWLGSRPPDAKMSFGYKRFEVMGAIVSILSIWILTATLVLVAIQRIYSNDYDLNANTMMTISGIGILINIIMIFVLHTSLLDLPAGTIGATHSHSHSHSHKHNSQLGHSHGYSHTHSPTLLHRRRHSNDSGHMHADLSTRSLLPADSDVDTDAIAATTAAAIDTDENEATSIEVLSAPIVFNGNLSKHQQDGDEKNLNLRAATIHVIGDLVQSIGVFLASVLIKIFPKAVFLDPLCTLLFSVIVIMTTINLFKESIHLIMDTVPEDISLHDLKIDLLNVEGVKSVHHLNVWNHTTNYSILMVHLVVDILTDSNTVLMKATQLAGSSKYNIKHSTIQIERLTS